MSRAEMSIGCPSCDDRAVEVLADGVSANGATSDEQGESVGVEPDPAFRDADRLTGTTVDCSNCGDEFEVYFY